MARPPHLKHRLPRPTGTDRHRVRPFLLGGTFLLALVGVLLLPLLGDGEPLSPGSLARDELAAVPRATEACPAPTYAESAAAGDASQRSTAAVEASATKNAARPFAPRDHLLVRVVDDATGEPIAGAEVAASLDRDEPVPAAELRRQQAIADPFERLRAGGQTAKSDPQGYAVLRGSHWMRVMARHGDLSVSASIELATVGAAGFLLRLRPEATTEVLVLDAQRRPLADVPLGLLVPGTTVGTWQTHGRNVDLGKTGADGSVRFQLHQHVHRHERGAALQVYVAAPGLTNARATIDMTKARFEIAMPAHGSVTLQVRDVDGAMPADSPSWTVLLSSMTRTDDEEVQPEEYLWGNGSGGEARFSYVGIGTELFAYASVGSETQYGRMAGPSFANEAIQHRLTMPVAGGARLRARLLDESGTPWTNTWVVAERGGRRLWETQARTDGDGRLLMHIPAAKVDAPIRLCGRERDGPLGHDRDLYLAADLDQDLGDLVLPRGHRIAKVTVVEERPTPPGFRLFVERTEDDEWNRSSEHRVERLDDTHFVVCGRSPVAGVRLRLRVDAPGCEAVQPVEFRPGDELTVQLREGLALVANILVSPEMLAEIEDESCSLTLTSDHQPAQRVYGRLQGDRWLVDFHGARAGRYRLVVQSSTVLAMLDDVVVAAGSPSDPRLDPWDLRTAIQPLQIRCVDADGQPRSVSGSLLLRTSRGDWESLGWFEHGALRALLPRRPLELMVQFDGGGFVPTSNMQDSVQVVVPRPTPTTITLQGMPELVPDAPIEVDVVVAESELRARGLPDVQLIGFVDWQRYEHTVSFELFAAASASVRFLRRGQDDQHEVLEQLPCALSAGTAIVLTVPDSLRERLQPWTQPR